jgi:ribosomal protein S18 acetylase RimI-like enzyme
MSMTTDTPPVIVRPATADDVPSVGRLAREDCPALPGQWTEATLRRIVAAGPGAGALLLAAERGAELVGFAGLKFWDEKVIVVGLAVAPAHRRRGAGRCLVAAALARAAAAGAVAVEAGLPGDNRAGQEFLRALGFRCKKVSRRLFAGRGGHFIFRRELTPGATATEDAT